MHRIIRRRCRRALGVRKSVAGLDNDADDDGVERFIV